MIVHSCRVYLEEMFDPGPEPAVPAVDEHRQVLRHDGGLGAPLQLQHSHILIRVKPCVIFFAFLSLLFYKIFSFDNHWRSERYLLSVIARFKELQRKKGTVPLMT